MQVITSFYGTKKEPIEDKIRGTENYILSLDRIAGFSNNVFM